MTKLELLINKLDNDKFSAVTITNNDTNLIIYRNKTSDTIITEFGNATRFFDDMLEKGYINLTVEPKRKNGNNFKPVDEVFTISPEVEAITQVNAPQPTEDFSLEKKKKKKKKKKDFFGLNGMLSSPVFDLATKAQNADNLLNENRSLKDENARLKEKNEELKIEQLEKRFTKENNDSRNALFLGAIQQAPLLAGMFGVKIPQVGLNAPDQTDLSEGQKKLVDLCKTTNDFYTDSALAIFTRLSNKIEGDTFEAEFIQLLNLHKLI